MARNRSARNQVRPQLEQLNARCLPAGNILFNPATGILSIAGTAAADRAVVTSQGRGSAERIVIQLSGAGQRTQVRSFREHDVRAVVFQGGSGNDVFLNQSSERSVALGGAGNDILVGGQSSDTLRGGLGDDRLLGRRGDDLLEGEAGDDRLNGGLGDDRMDGGVGNDDMHGGLGDDGMDGGSGRDSVSGDGSRNREHGGEHDAADVRFEASLGGANGAIGKAEFNATTKEFELQIRGGPANATLDVLVDGVKVGAVTTDALGRGELELNGAVVGVHDQSTITVGDPSNGGLSGTFLGAAESELKAALTGATGDVRGKAEFNGADQRLEVEVRGGAASTGYDVTIDGVKVGTITTDREGEGELELSTGSLTVHDGSTITVGDPAAPLLGGTFHKSDD